MEHYLSLATKAIFVENMALAFFLGMCSFLAVSKKVDQAVAGEIREQGGLCQRMGEFDELLFCKPPLPAVSINPIVTHQDDFRQMIAIEILEDDWSDRSGTRPTGFVDGQGNVSGFLKRRRLIGRQYLQVRCVDRRCEIRLRFFILLLFPNDA